MTADLIERLRAQKMDNPYASEYGKPARISVPLCTEAADELSALRERRDTLLAAIQHGDDEHQAWLKDAIAAHFTGQAVPEPRGRGNKDVLRERVEALEGAAMAFIAKLDHCAPYVADAFLHRELRCGEYDGPNYIEELKALRAILAQQGEEDG